MPDILEEFQEMKYTGSKKWNDLKYDYKILGVLAKKDWEDNFKSSFKKGYLRFRGDGFTPQFRFMQHYIERVD